MGKRLLWTAVAGLVSNGALAAPPEPLPPGELDWQPWGANAPRDALCPGRYVMPDYRLAAGSTPQEVVSSSQRAEYGDQGAVILRGDVVLRRNTRQLEADELRINAARDTIFADGDLALRDSGLLVRGDSAQVALNSDAARIDDAHYVAHQQRLRGDAQRLARLEDGRFRLSEASFTTCAPDSRLWRLVGDDILLDREQGYGTATDARLEVGRVPVFYWPWVRFPIDDRRQSGFLWPTLAYSSGEFDYTQPYYFNLAPNYDAILAPRWLGDHGLMLGGQLRYLFDDDEGYIEGAYLADDRGEANDNPNDPPNVFEGEERWYIDFAHSGRFTPRTDYALRYGAASDGRYFEDFGREFGAGDTEFLPRQALLDYRGTTWSLEAEAQGYQRLEYPLQERDKPFYRLPSLTANATWRQDSGFYQQWRSNATYFWRDIDQTQVQLRESATGGRVHLAPALGWRGETTWGFVEPRVSMLQTNYELDYGRRDTDRDTSLSRTLPATSLDSGLIFERNLHAFENDWRQTLEPRLYYAYVPRRDQEEFPDFDTDELAYSYDRLWSPYRFSSVDRIGDVNKVSYGMTSRFLEDDSGRERFALGVGQSTYFEDRSVEMRQPWDTRDDYDLTRQRSPVIAQLDWRIDDRWNTRYEWFYDTERDLTERTATYLRYRHPQGHVLNLGYRWQREGFDPSGDREDRLGYDLEEYDVSFAYRATSSLDLIGRFTYDSTNDRELEQLAGVQWNDCCYAFQIAWRQWVEDNDTANTVADDYTDSGLLLRFVFKGLGGVGKGTASFFEESIPGYQPTQF